MRNNILQKINTGKILTVIIIICGLVSLYRRFQLGLGAVTHLSDNVPWGLWIGFDFVGIGLAASGFIIAAAAYVFNINNFEKITRPAILTAYIGYILVVALLIIDLGRPQNFWHPLTMWNFHSIMFEITWCIVFYTLILTIEFAPVILEKLGLSTPFKLLKKITIPAVVLGALFSTLHQSSFGSIYLINPGRLHPIWYSELLPVNFFISCIAAGISIMIVELYIYKRQDAGLLPVLGKAAFYVLIVGSAVRIADMAFTGRINAITDVRPESFSFYSEIILGTIIPILLLSSRKFRSKRLLLLISSLCIISGFILNRLNVVITGFTATSGVKYFPSFEEISITLMLIVLGIWAFKLSVKYFNIFGEDNPKIF
jgi:Ni/Fe-hydrogenase subunit HybB-like protein